MRATLLYSIIQSLVAFPLTPKHVTSNDLEWPFCVKFCFAPVRLELWSLAFEAWLLQTCSECCRRTLNQKEQLLHRAVSLRQHGFLIISYASVALLCGCVDKLLIKVSVMSASLSVICIVSFPSCLWIVGIILCRSSWNESKTIRRKFLYALVRHMQLLN